MPRAELLAIALCLAGLASHVHAQEMTIEELKSKGGTAVSKDELAGRLSGSTMRYTSFANGRPIQYKLATDGSYVGNIQTAGKSQDVAGKWRIEDNGRFCRTQEAAGQAENFCYRIWKLGEKYHLQSGQRLAELTFEK
jgi:hypothetical protein